MDNQIFIKRVWMPDGSIVSANLVYRDRPTLILDTGEEITDDKNEITYEMNHEYIVDKKGETVQISLKKPVRLYLTPRFVATRKYSIDAKEDDLDIYPSSSNGFYGRLVRGKIDAVYILNEILNASDSWITIFQDDIDKIHESHRIKPYEIDVIRLKTYAEHFHELVSSFSGPNPKEITDSVLGVINTAELTWADIHKLTGGMVPQDFTRTKNNREMLGQIVPIDEFVEDTQDEVLAFLIWAAKGLMPNTELVEFIDQIHALPIFRALFLSHLRFILDGENSPHYSKIIKEILERKTTGTPLLREERVKWDLAAYLRRQLQKMTPDWQSELVDVIRSLNESNEIITVYPIPKSSAKSQSAQRSRLLMWDMGLKLKVHVRPQSIGLRELVYIGAAHRWPHWHLSSSLRLGPPDIRAPYMHSMIMPPSAAEQVKRVLPSVHDIEWSTHRMNVQLYSQSKKKWTLRENHIIKAFDGKKSLKDLKKEFGYWRGTSCYQVTQPEARLLDMGNTMFYLSDLESKGGEKYWKTDETTSRKNLSKLRDSGIIEVSYWFDDFKQSLVPIYFSLDGKESIICSVASAFAKYVPTSLTRVVEGGSTVLIASRLPKEEANSFIERLLFEGKNEGITIKTEPLSTHRNYTVDLYQRLLNSDGSWNSDVTGLLSQVRSKQKPE